ncbi:MAG: HNH endonuclease [Chloracidobacterium sp.]
MVPWFGIGATGAKWLKKADKASQAATCAARGTSQPTGQFYSVAFETRLISPTSYPGVSRGRHFQEANENLLRVMEGDAGFAQAMQQGGISLQRTATGLTPRTPPAGWTWHHAPEAGVMQLVPCATGSAFPARTGKHFPRHAASGWTGRLFNLGAIK